MNAAVSLRLTEARADFQVFFAYSDAALRIVLKRYSPQTLKNYQAAFQQFLSYCAPCQPLELQKQEVLDYLSQRIAAGISESYQNLLINAIKFYYEQVEGQPRQSYDLARPKRPQQNPKLLAKEEVKALLQLTDNIKHRAMLMLAYGLGLRISEVLALTPADVDARRMVLYVRGGKGKKTETYPCPIASCCCCASSFASSGPSPSCLKARKPVSRPATGACSRL